MTLKAFDQGKHVICEKPMGLTLGEAEAMLKRAEEKRLIHVMVFNWRFVPAVFRMKELVEEGEVGSIYHASFSWFGNSRRNRESPFNWRFLRDEAGYGALGDIGVHGIDLIHWMAGDLKRIISQMNIFIPEHKVEAGKYKRTEVEDSCAFLGELAGGGQVVFHVSNAASCEATIRLEIHGDKGGLRAELFPRSGEYNGKLYGQKGVTDLRKEIEIPGRLTSAVIPHSEKDSFRAITFARFARQLVRPLQNGQNPSPNFYDGLKTQKVLQALTQSWQEKEWIDLM
jgi:predicted dehydrogenase